MAITITDYDGATLKGNEEIRKFTKRYNCDVVDTGNKVYISGPPDRNLLSRLPDKWEPEYFADDLKTHVATEYNIRITMPDLLRLMAEKNAETERTSDGEHTHRFYHSYRPVDSETRAAIAELDRIYGWQSSPSASFVILDLVSGLLEKKKEMAAEVKVRDKNPAVKLAWEQYQLLLAMCKDD